MLPLKVGITFQSDFSVGSGHGLAGLVDRAVVKTRHGLPYIPGTTIKGNLRNSCEEISRMLDLDPAPPDNPGAHIHSPVARIFGTPYLPSACTFGTAYLRGTPSEVFFKDYLTIAEPHNRIDPFTRTAMRDHFFALETADKGLAYDFEIGPNLSSGTNLSEEDKNLLVAGILYTDRLGAKKSRGRGDCRLEIASGQSDWIEQMTAWLDQKVAAQSTAGAPGEK